MNLENVKHRGIECLKDLDTGLFYNPKTNKLVKDIKPSKKGALFNKNFTTANNEVFIKEFNCCPFFYLIKRFKTIPKTEKVMKFIEAIYDFDLKGDMSEIHKGKNSEFYLDENQNIRKGLYFSELSLQSILGGRGNYREMITFLNNIIELHYLPNNYNYRKTLYYFIPTKTLKFSKYRQYALKSQMSVKLNFENLKIRSRGINDKKKHDFLEKKLKIESSLKIVDRNEIENNTSSDEGLVTEMKSIEYKNLDELQSLIYESLDLDSVVIDRYKPRYENKSENIEAW